MKITFDDFELESVIAQTVREKFKSLVGNGQYMTITVEKPIPKITITVDIKYSSSD